MKLKCTLLLLAAVAAAAGSCNRGPKITRTDTETSGFAVIAADECFEPFVKEQLAVFTGLNPEATIDPLFVGERDLFSLLMSDSVRLIVAARELTRSESDSIRRMNLTPRTQRLARDGIALIVNRANPDSMINAALFRRVLRGDITQWSQISRSANSIPGDIKIVFDNPNSSTLRFVRDSIMRGEALSPNVRAVRSNPAVIDFVAKNPDALGIIGVNWISNPTDTTQLLFDETIRVMSVGNGLGVSPETTFKPFPAFLNNGSYPFVRDVFIILTDSRGGLPSGFVKFAAGDAGQRIILRAGLVPGTRPNREIMISNDF